MAAIRRRIAGLAIVAMVGLVPGPVREASAAPELPEAPIAALGRQIAVLGARLGVPLDPEPALAVARLDPGLAGRLAVLLQALDACMDASALLMDGGPEPSSTFSGDAPARPSPTGVAAVRACADRLQRQGLELERFLAADPSGSDVELWPVLRLDLDGSDDTVVHDYMLSVDVGGNDLYTNNAGSNLIDVRRGPAGSRAPSRGPARGCVLPAYDLLAGECVISEALLVDVAGDDTYGRMEPPDPGLDGLCTDDPIVRRVMTAGVGSWGVGILLEGGGNDHYLSKTISQGAGHFGGVGILLDESGDDTYSAFRMAQGFATLFGVGVHHDGGGNDTYTYYVPRPLNPAAPDKTLGAGGVLDTGGLCDKIPRWTQGTGFLGGVGVLVDDGGDDDYQAAPPMPHEPGAFGFIRGTGSQGFGDGAGFGALMDLSGRDSYIAMPGRADGETVGPSDSSSGFFHDESGGANSVDTAAPAAAAPSGALTAWFNHYIPETVTIDRGAALQFFNPDLYGGPFGAKAHTITELRPDGPPRFDGTALWGTAANIEGVAALSAGRYTFTCQIHPFMRGTLVVR